MIRALVVVALLAGCQTGPGGRFSDADTCAELIAAFESVAVPNDADERKELGDEYRARFRELDCEL